MRAIVSGCDHGPAVVRDMSSDASGARRAAGDTTTGPTGQMPNLPDSAVEREHGVRMTRPRGVLALSAAALLALAVGGTVTAGAAQAGTAGHWTTISTGKLGIIDQPDVARGTDGRLHVVYHDDANPSAPQIDEVAVGANGSLSAASHPVGPGLQSLIDDPKAVQIPGGELRLVYAGIGPGNDGRLWTSPSSDGGTIYAPPTPLGDRTTAYASYGTGATFAGGTMWSSWSINGALYVHRGTDASVADMALSNVSSGGGTDCCAYDTSLAGDSVTGAVSLGWYSNSSAQGIFVQQISPSPGTPAQAPGSATTYAGAVNSRPPDQAVALTGRPGASGVWAAYCHGYPTCTGVSLWRVGAPSALAVPTSGNAGQVGLAAAPGGRLWVFWWPNSSRDVFAVRTNPAVTRFGAVRHVALPSAGTVWSQDGDAAHGLLDLVANFDPDAAGTDPRLIHTQVLPGLSVTRTPHKVASSSAHPVTFHVTDAGTPVRGASVRVAGHHALTNARGVATFTVPKGTHTGTKLVTASHSGYYRGTTHLRIT
jgi:hypothetical protein